MQNVSVNVEIPDVIKKEQLIPYNITHDQVVNSVTNEDVKKVIKLGINMTLILFLKKLNDYYLFVGSQWKSESQTLQIANVLKIANDFLRNVSIDNPLAVLEKFSNEVGYNIEIGDQNAKFIHDATIRITPASNQTFLKTLYGNLKITDDYSKKAGPYIGFFHFRSLPNSTYVDISLACFINVEKYTNYLQTNGFLE